MVDNGKIIRALSNLNLDVSGLSEETIDVSAFEFYKSRLTQCLEDGCPAAANAYLEKLQRDTNINGSTKLEILYFHSKLSLKED